MTAKDKLEFIKEGYPDVLIADGFDKAIIGMVERSGMNPVVLYNKNKCINIMIKRDGMTEEEATERMAKAVRNPNVHILGHPTGRLLLSRDGYPLDLRAVLDAAAETDTSVEVNANPRRLDIDWRHLAYAKAQGVMISINTDAHSIAGLEQMNYGVGIARKGGLAVSDVLNALPIDGFLTQINKQK